MKSRSTTTSVLLFAGWMLLTAQIQAAIFYADYVGGNDASAGTSTGAAWQRHPWDSRATGTSAGTTLAAGDVVILKGGVEYELTGTNDVISATSSGTLNSRITLDGDSGVYASRWGSGTNRAVIDGNYTAKRHITINGQGSINLNFLELKMGGYGDQTVRLNNATNCTLNELYVHRRFDWDMSSGPGKLGSYMLGIGSGIETLALSKNIIIQNCEITRVGGGGIGVGDKSTEITVRTNDIHSYIVWHMAIGTDASGEGLTNIYVHNNRIRDMFYYSGGYWDGSFTSELVNFGDPADQPHHDGIFLRQQVAANTDKAIENLQIFNNDFYNNLAGFEAAGTAWIFASYIKTNSSIRIYNNVFQKPYATPSISLGWNIYNDYNIKIYHNTFVGAVNDLQITEYVASPTHQFILRNNLFAGESAFQPQFTTPGTCSSLYGVLDSDYNFFSTAADAVSIGECTGIINLGAWITATGGDANSVSGAPGFVDPQSGASSSLANYRLGSSSPAIEIFPALSTNDFPGADRDKDGNLRGTVLVTSGAFGGAVAQPSPGGVSRQKFPRSLRINGAR